MRDSQRGEMRDSEGERVQPCEKRAVWEHFGGDLQGGEWHFLFTLARRQEAMFDPSRRLPTILSSLSNLGGWEGVQGGGWDQVFQPANDGVQACKIFQYQTTWSSSWLSDFLDSMHQIPTATAGRSWRRCARRWRRRSVLFKMSKFASRWAGRGGGGFRRRGWEKGRREIQGLGLTQSQVYIKFTKGFGKALKREKRAKTPGKRKSVQIRFYLQIPSLAIFLKAPQRAFSVFKIYFFESTNNCASCVKACILYSHIESEGGPCCCMREVRDGNATGISVFSYFWNCLFRSVTLVNSVSILTFSFVQTNSPEEKVEI